ncbi:phosphatidate cytidylyltransferase [Aliiroseovarius sp.]|uniref:phosphatidate cytidylyltransferase n=1 Tax=Aliiroseovarius sp. TaxID=1872442 RepID=UPI00261B0A42|nr:phosphatidate cytidylyltransferase [Aliiroseovarius sp.]
MSTTPEFGILALAALGLLLVASLIGELLQSRLSPEGEHPEVEAYMSRIHSWWGMALLLGLAGLFGRTGLIVLFALISFAALREFLSLTAKRRADHWALVTAFFVILPVQYVLVWMDWYGMYSIFVPVYAFLFLPIVSVLRGDTDRFLMRVAETQWGLMICVFAGSHIPALLALPIEGFEGRNLLLVIFLVLVVQLADVMSYVAGKVFGRRPLAAGLSPSRTREGFFVATLAGGVIGAGLSWMTPFGLAGSAALGLVVAALGLMGGLVLSAIKRDKGVRDWGHLMAGHGGFIDRLDGVVFAAPVFFHLVRYGWT